MKDSQRINNLTFCSQVALFGISYSPLFIILCAKILYSKSEYLHWGGFNSEAVATFFQQFWAVILIFVVLLYSIIGTTKLLGKVKQTASCNSRKVTIKNITDKSSETINYIATYIIPFIYDVQSDFDMAVMLFIIVIIYFIYVNSSLLAINPILALGYGLYEIEYEEGSSNYTVIVIAQNKYLLEGDEIDVYPIGRKLYYSQDNSKIN